MENEVFYVYPQKGRDTKGDIIPDKEHPVTAKFLVVNGKFVPDPNVKGSQEVRMYKRLLPGGKIDESSIFKNENNYLVVPASYDPSEAVRFATNLDANMAGVYRWLGPGVAIASALPKMTEAFIPGGSEDLQRGQQWGVPAGETSPLFRDAASWHLGYVTQLAGLPAITSETGAGLLHSLGGAGETPDKRDYRSPQRQREPGAKGPEGMDEENYQDFLQGMRDAKVSEATGVMSQYDKLHEDLANVGNTAVTPVGRLRSFAHDARAASRNKALPEAMRLHRQIQRLRHERRSFAPTRAGRDGSTESASPTFAMATFEPFMAMALARRVMGGEAVAGGRAGAALRAVLHKAAVAVGGGGGVSPGMRAALGGLAPPELAGGRAGAFGQQLNSARTAYAGSVAAALRRLAGDGAVLARGGSGGSGGLPSIAPRRGAAAAAATAMATRAASDGVGTILGAVARGQMTRGLAPRTVGREATGSALAGPHVARSKAAEQQDVARAIQAYLEGQARLPPASGAGFDPRLTPAWAGLQLPG